MIVRNLIELPDYEEEIEKNTKKIKDLYNEMLDYLSESLSKLTGDKHVL